MNIMILGDLMALFVVFVFISAFARFLADLPWGKIWRRKSVGCRFGFHPWEGKCANVQTDYSGKPVTLCFWECPKCGSSKLKCILSNWDGTAP